jgi:hypothetical protein
MRVGESSCRDLTLSPVHAGAIGRQVYSVRHRFMCIIGYSEARRADTMVNNCGSEA